MRRVLSVASRALPRSSKKHRGRALHVRVQLKDGRTVEGYVRHNVLIDEEGLLLLTSVTRTFDSDMNEILTTPLDAAIARNQVVDMREVAMEGPASASPPAPDPDVAESEQVSTEDEELHVRLLLKNGRTVEGIAERNALFDADELVVLTRVVQAFDSAMREVPANPLDAAVPRGQIVEIEKVMTAPAENSEAVVVASESEPEPSAPEPEVSEPEPSAPEPEPSAPEPITIRTGSLRARDLSPRDDLAVGVLRMRAAQTRVRGAHISLVVFGLVALALVAFLLSSRSNNADQSASAAGSPSASQSPVPTPFGGAKEIAFLRDISGVPQVHLLELSGGSPAPLAPSGVQKQRPDFSSDGDKLAYSTEVERRQDIFVSRLDGTGAINVTNNDSDDYVPGFSPDGESITFTSNLVGDFDIYILDLKSGDTAHSLTTMHKKPRRHGLLTGRPLRSRAGWMGISRYTRSIPPFRESRQSHRQFRRRPSTRVVSRRNHVGLRPCSRWGHRGFRHVLGRRRTADHRQRCGRSSPGLVSRRPRSLFWSSVSGLQSALFQIARTRIAQRPGRRDLRRL
ncbi:MAG: TolB family protein [Actinomycetota bacterium]